MSSDDEHFDVEVGTQGAGRPNTSTTSTLEEATTSLYNLEEDGTELNSSSDESTDDEVDGEGGESKEPALVPPRVDQPKQWPEEEDDGKCLFDPIFHHSITLLHDTC